MKNVVVIGGGTGLSTLLRGLKLFPMNITAIVTVADDGSSTGRLREEFDIPAVGDLRNVLVSLSEVEPLVEELLQYRFDTYSDLNKHAMGNLLLTAMYNITGSLTDSLEALSRIFNIKGSVLPFTEDKAILMAHTKDGEVIEGESKITKAGKQIKYVSYKNKVKVTPQVLKAVEEADLIIIGIGSLYTSIIPNLLSKEMTKALKQSSAKKMYICNIMSEHGETDGYNVSDCVKQINKYVDKNFIDVVLANKKIVPDYILKLYEEEKSAQILVDKENIHKMGVKLITADLLSIENNQARHDYIKTALEVFTYLTRGCK
ncbi:MAG: YvcK family protein [Bacilli bacterium]|nr:YvcK family protein [Bacilli bacterium]